MKNNKLLLFIFVFLSSSIFNPSFSFDKRNIQESLNQKPSGTFPKEEKTNSKISFQEIKKTYEAKKYPEVLQLTGIYLKSFPNDSDVWLFQGYANYQLNHFNESYIDFKKVISITSTYEDAWVGLINVLIREKYFDDALTTIKEGLTKFPNSEKISQKEKEVLALQTQIKEKEEKDKKQEKEEKEKKEKEKEIQKKIGDSYKFPYSYDSILKETRTVCLDLAKKHALIYLKKYPYDLDVVFLLGQIYQREENWGKAYIQYREVLLKNPSYPHVVDANLSMLFILKRYPEVIQLANRFLYTSSRAEKDALLLYIGSAQEALHLYPAALSTLQKISNFKQNKRAYALYEQINLYTNYRYVHYFQMGAGTSLIPVKNPDQFWTISSLYAQYHTPRGGAGLAVNYQTRPGPGLKSPQYVAYATPQWTETNYTFISYANANNPFLFPNQLISVEDFQSLPKGFQISGGNTYRKLPGNYFNTYTGSLGKYIKSYYLEFRPYYFTPKIGKTSLLYAFTAKKFFGPQNYLGFVINNGSSPDLANLNEPFIRTQVQTYLLVAQYQLSKRFDIQGSVGEQIQNFGKSNIRYYKYVNVGIDFRDVP